MYSILYRGLLENWEKEVPGYIGTFTLLSPGTERYIEEMTGVGFKAGIFFVKDYKLNNMNRILYRNTTAGITFLIQYISNSPDHFKIEAMRKIVKEMKFNQLNVDCFLLSFL